MPIEMFKVYGKRVLLEEVQEYFLKALKIYDKELACKSFISYLPFQNIIVIYLSENLYLQERMITVFIMLSLMLSGRWKYIYKNIKICLFGDLEEKLKKFYYDEKEGVLYGRGFEVKVNDLLFKFLREILLKLGCKEVGNKREIYEGV